MNKTIGVSIFALTLFICVSGGAAVIPAVAEDVCGTTFVPGLQKTATSPLAIPLGEVDTLEAKIKSEPWFATDKPVPIDQKLLEFIPILAKVSRPNFDFGDWIRRTVDFTGFEREFEHPNASKWLLRYHEYWKNRVDAVFYQKTARRLLELGSTEDLIKRIDSIYESLKGNPAFLDLLFGVVDSPRYYLELLSYLNVKLIPPDIMTKIQPWLSQAEPVTSSAISVVRHSGQFCGRCPKLSYGHRRVLLEKGQRGYGRAVFIYVQGHLVGSVKVHDGRSDDPIGDPSMVALTNVFDRSGNQVLYAGGVYKLQPDMVERAVELIHKGQTFPQIRTNRLEVVPLQFLGGDYTHVSDPLRWHRRNVGQMEEVAATRR